MYVWLACVRACNLDSSTHKQTKRHPFPEMLVTEPKQKMVTETQTIPSVLKRHSDALLQKSFHHALSCSPSAILSVINPENTCMPCAFVVS